MLEITTGQDAISQPSGLSTVIVRVTKEKAATITQQSPDCTTDSLLEHFERTSYELQTEIL